MENRKRDYRAYRQNTSYIDGNTVRQPEVPEYGSEYIRRQREEKARQRRRAYRAKQKKAMIAQRNHVLFLLVVCTICAVSAVMFIMAKANISKNMTQVAALQTEITELRIANEEAQNRLETTMTLDAVKEKATELGLVYPTAKQIRYYTVQSSDYMNQYGEIESK